MGKGDEFIVKGQVIECLKGAKFKVKVDDKTLVVECVLGGKIRQNNIRILNGDHVDIAISTVDPYKGRIVWRY